jgi:hypothetical protein
MKKLLITLCLLASLWGAKARAQAANIYITQSGSTSGGCTTSVQTPAFFNNAANWGTGGTQIGPGTTVLACGTFTALAGTCGLFAFQGSGTSGNPITLKWDTGAIMQAPYFCANHDSGAIDLVGHNWIVIDGGTNGILQNTANGTGLANQSQSTLVGLLGASNVTVKNLAELNLYVRSGSDTVCATNNDWCWSIASGIGGSSVTIGPGMTFTWCDVCVKYDFQGGENNLRITGNNFSHYNQAIEMGPSNTGTKVMTNVRVDHNIATPSRDWDEPANYYHHNFFHPFTNTAGSSFTGNLIIDDNSVRGDVGTHLTSELAYLENNNGSGGGTMGPWYVFNNLVQKTNTDPPGGDGMFVPLYGVSNGYLLYNTFVDAGSSTGTPMAEFNMTGTSWTDEGNIYEQSSTSYYFGNGNTSNPPTADYNIYFGGAQWTWFPTPPGYTSSFSTWKTFCSCDSHSLNGTDPTLNGTTLKPGVIATVFGPNLTTLAGTLGIPDLLNDINGSARGAGTWTVGAINFTSGTPATPTNISVIVVGP